MKNRLQKLWDETVPHPGPAPAPEAKNVLCRVDAVLGEHAVRRRRAGRPLRLAVVCAAALVLLSGVAVASGQLPLPENNVLARFFSWGTSDEEYAASLVNAEALSVEDEHLSITVTSSVADENEAYLTLEVFAKTEEARQFLRSGDLVEEHLFNIEMSGPFGGGSRSISFEMGSSSGGFATDMASWEQIKKEADCYKIDANLELGLSRTVRISLDAPTGALELKVPVEPVHSVTLRLNAEGPGSGCREHAAGGPVEISTVTISPLTVAVSYTTPNMSMGDPLFYFLWKDGTWSTQGQLHLHPSSSSGALRGEISEYEGVWQFGSVQSIAKMEAIVFNSTAYPLDGGEPYQVDVSGLPAPFAVPTVPEIGGAEFPVPLSALCEGLGIPFDWDGERAVMCYRDVEVTVTAGSDVVQIRGASENVDTLRAPAVWQDGELWANSYPISSVWNLSMEFAKENVWVDPWTWARDTQIEYWLVIP